MKLSLFFSAGMLLTVSCTNPLKPPTKQTVEKTELPAVKTPELENPLPPIETDIDPSVVAPEFRIQKEKDSLRLPSDLLALPKNSQLESSIPSESEKPATIITRPPSE